MIYKERSITTRNSRSEHGIQFIFTISGDQLSAFEVVVSQLLEDVQERLVYRAQVRVDCNTWNKAMSFQ